MIIDNDTDQLEKDINEKLESLKASDKLTFVEAITRANEIVQLVNKLIERKKGGSVDLYAKVADAYTFAAEKIDKL